LSEEEQLKAAMQASMEDLGQMDKKDGSESKEDMEDEDDAKPAAVPPLIESLLLVSVGDEPSTGARTQLRLPDGKRIVRKFNPSDKVKIIFAYLAVSFTTFSVTLSSFCPMSGHSDSFATPPPFPQQSIEEAKQGREFVLMTGFPPRDLLPDMEKTVDECELSGQAITVRWKD
jgi:hypothetical protein